jgi:SAM-dependent methyltransferase
MHAPLDQHRVEIERNQSHWAAKPLLQKIYAGFYEKIIARIDPAVSGRIVELGSGIGNLKRYSPGAIATDLFPNPWLDLACDAYSLPFRNETISHLILFDVFHHLERPHAFLAEARRALAPGGRVILFEPYISLASAGAYGLAHHEPIAWREPINLASEKPPLNRYYAAQGNATRLFFATGVPLPPGWRVGERIVLCSFAYLLSGGFSKPSLYPRFAFPMITRLDKFLSRFPRVFGARCLVVLHKTSA